MTVTTKKMKTDVGERTEQKKTKKRRSDDTDRTPTDVSPKKRSKPGPTGTQKLKVSSPGKPFQHGKGKKQTKKFHQKRVVSKPKSSIKGPEESWKEYKEKIKKKRMERALHDPFYIVVQKTKAMWEKLRQRNCPPEEQTKLAEAMYKNLSGKMINVIRTHDIARVVQWLIKKGSVEMRHKVMDELIESFASLAQCKYSKHVVEEILQHCDAGMKSKMIQAFSGNVVRLLSNQFSCKPLSKLYTEYANNEQMAQIRQELYSDIFKGAGSSVTCLNDAFKESSDMKDALLSSTKKTLTKLLEKPTCLDSAIVHDVLKDFLTVCKDSDRTAFTEIIISAVSSFACTKSGHQLVLSVAQNSSAQVRKRIINSLRERLNETYKNRYGCSTILGLLDLVDDTVRSGGLVRDLLQNPQELVVDSNGRRIILHLVGHWDPTYFHPADINILKQSNEFSKKPPSKKIEELLKLSLPLLLRDIVKNPVLWLSKSKVALVTLAILKAASSSGDLLSSAHEAITQRLIDPEFTIKENNKDWPAIEHAGIHFFLKKLTAHDKDLATNGHRTFSEHVVSNLDQGVVIKWLSSNRGSFFIVFMLKTGVAAVIEVLKEILSAKKVKEVLKASGHQGAALIKDLIDV